MDSQDRQAIEGLFHKLKTAEQSVGYRDAEADRFIQDKMAAQPAAAYLLAQTVLVQEQALTSLNQRVSQLEEELRRRPATTAQSSGGGFLSGLFGGSKPAAPAPSPLPWGAQGQGQAAGYGQGYGAPMGQPMPQHRSGGGFLAGAMQTAVGVAGGMMLGNMLGNMFSGEAQAAEQAIGEIGSQAEQALDGFGSLDMTDLGNSDEEGFF